jgi:hypothetical protein
MGAKLSSMARRVFLPLSAEGAGDDALPSSAAMRKRLGGRVAGEISVVTPHGTVTVGSFVDFVTSDSRAKRSGVLLTVEGESVDVYVTDGLVRRTRAEYLSPRSRAVPELVPIAESAAVFARLGEGQAVEVERAEGDVEKGTLLEKCRYGALVRLANDVVLAVGFRKVWPARVPASSPYGASGEPGLTN